jgi:hypothetical protein
MNWLALTNPWMLAALAAVGLPVLIHYLTRARPRKVAFPPFKFLIEACAGKQSVHRLRTFLLLALRCLAVAALVLLFARPFLKPARAAGGADASRKVVLVVDASLSMRAVQRGVTLFARAQSEAANVLREVENGTEAGLILAGATPRPLLPALSRNLPALHEELVKAQATFEHGDMDAALAQAKAMLGGTGTLYVFSDFQKSNWETVRELPAGVACKLRPVTDQPVDNIAIVGAELTPASPVAGETVEVVCTVFNCSARPVEQNIRLDLGETAQERRIAVSAFGTGQASFNVVFPRTGSFTGKASLSPDDLLEDNSRYFAVTVQKALQVLLASDADVNDQKSAAFFVQRALAPSETAAPGLTIVRRHSQDTDRGILETADVFMLVAPAKPSGEAGEIISRRVQEGARLISVLDGPTTPLLVPAACNPPFQLQRAVFSADGDSLVTAARLLFPDSDAADWSGFRFYRHYQNQVLETRRNDIVLSYPDGSAALTISSVGKGAAVFINLPLTPEGGDFIGNPLFPATLHELLRTLRKSSGERAVMPGQSWVLESAGSTDAAVTVRDPRGETIAAPVLASGRTTRLAMPPAMLPGIYTVNPASGTNSTGAGAVNIDPRESDTRLIALDGLKAGAGTSITLVKDEASLVLGEKAIPLWPKLAAAAVVCLGLEMLLLAVWRKTGSTP